MSHDPLDKANLLKLFQMFTLLLCLYVLLLYEYFFLSYSKEKMGFERVYFNVFGYTQQDMLKFASFLSIL